MMCVMHVSKITLLAQMRNVDENHENIDADDKRNVFDTYRKDVMLGVLKKYSMIGAYCKDDFHHVDDKDYFLDVSSMHVVLETDIKITCLKKAVKMTCLFRLWRWLFHAGDKDDVLHEDIKNLCLLCMIKITWY